VKSFFWHEPKTPKRLSSSTSVNLFTLELLYNIIKLLRNLIILPITPINAVMVLIAINSIATSEGWFSSIPHIKLLPNYVMRWRC
jgi:hypothetical protein